MVDGKIKINYRVFLILFLIFPMIKCDETAMATFVGSTIARYIGEFLVLWNFLSLGITALLFFSKLLRRGLKFVKIYTWLAFIMFIVFTISTLQVSDNITLYNIIREIGNIVAIFMLANTYAENEFIYFLQGVYYYLTLLMLFNALIIYIFPPMYYNSNGSAYYLFGVDNLSFLYSMNGFFTGMIYYLSRDRKVRFPFFALYAFIGGAYVYSGTGTGTIIFIICALFIVVHKNQLLDILDYKKSLIICLLIFVFFVFIQNLTYFAGILQFIGKDSGMNGRAQLWAAAFSQFPKHMLMGAGISTKTLGYYLLLAGVTWGRDIGHLHNVVIEILFKGGLINFAVFILMWLGCYRSVQHAERDTLKNNILCMLVIGFLAYMFEYRLSDITFWIILLSLYNLPALQGKSDSEKMRMHSRKRRKRIVFRV